MKQMPKIPGIFRVQARQKVKHTKATPFGQREKVLRYTYNWNYTYQANEGDLSHLENDELPRCPICSCKATFPKDDPYWCTQCYEILYEKLTAEKDPSIHFCVCCKEPAFKSKWCSNCFDNVYKKLIDKTGLCLNCDSKADEPIFNPTWCNLCYSKIK